MKSSQTLLSIAFRSFVVLFLLASGLASAIWLFSTSPVPPSSVRTELKRQVDVVEVDPAPVLRNWVGYGVSRAVNSVDVPSEVSSIVTELPSRIQAGARVTRGEVLVQLDEGDFRQQYEIAERSLNEISTRRLQLDVDETNAGRLVELGEEDVKIVRDELERIKRALADGAANPREVDLVRQRLVQSETSLTATRANLLAIPTSRKLLDIQEASQTATRDLAMRNVERCTISSAIDGVLESVEIELGERITPGRMLARIVNLDFIEVEVRLPSSARPSISVDNKVTLTARGAEDRSWNARITRISPVDDPASRTMAAYVELTQSGLEQENSPMMLAPGTFLSAKVESTYPTPRITLPSTSVKNDRIWFADESGLVQSIPVEVAFPIEIPGSRSDRRLVLKTMLPSGTKVLIHANQSPSIGTPVDVKVVELDSDSSLGAGT